jgi:hypothetical protein
VNSAGSTPKAKSQRQALAPNDSTSRMIAETITAAMYPSAHPDCMMLMALVRCSGGHVSLTSTAPLAHSPPMPIPSRMRQIISCHTVCDVAAPREQKEKIRMVPISARVRPTRSAMTPKRMPPPAEVRRVKVPSSPAVASSKPKYALSSPMAMT